ncbi:MAG: hypothetical protein SFW67_36190 [Myxococcaceae bacterium]|nr:hypothetical protein [Myxococcaceae bacterium]
MTGLHRALLVGALAHGALSAACLVALTRQAEPILGVHPALKPFKFAVSIALLLGSLAWVLPRVETTPFVREALAWLLLGTMVVEMAIILGQAWRGTTSHFNLRTPFDAGLWHAMQAAIVLATVGLVAIAVLATRRPLEGVDEVLQFAWRAGLWLTLLAAVSGFRMGGGLAHSVGGPDGSAGFWLVNWSRTLGDLRVSHFVSLHALQVVPLVAWLAAAVLPTSGQWASVVGTSALAFALCVGTLAQALLGRPVV